VATIRLDLLGATKVVLIIERLDPLRVMQLIDFRLEFDRHCCRKMH
jgi:hypothetical protein